MQKKLFLEKIDGTDNIEHEQIGTSKDNAAMYIMRHYAAIFNETLDVLAQDPIDCRKMMFQFDNLRGVEYLKKNNVPFILWNQILGVMLRDEFLRTFGIAFNSYKKGEGKNYVMSKNLTKYLEKISLDVPVTALPEKYTAYFEPQGLKDELDGSDVICCFASIGDFMGIDSVVLGIVTKGKAEGDYQFRSFNIGDLKKDRERNRTLDEVCNDYIDLNKVTNERQTKDNTPASKSSCIRTLINAILYVSNPNESFNVKTNTFDKKRSKRRVQQKIYTKKEFIEIGYENAEHLKLQLEKETEVRWHFRDQPHGPGRTLRKKILIAPHVRKYKKTIKD